MSRKIGSGVRPSNHKLGRRILKFKTEFKNASWIEVGRRFGISAKAFYRIERELRRLICKLYGDANLRDQIDEFGCIVCGKAIDFDRMHTMQCAKCDGERPGLVVKVDFRTRGELCLA